MLDFASDARFVFWTGGLDSSFRIFQLCRVAARPVQPIYLIDFGRASMVRELRTISALRAMTLDRFPQARERLLATAIFLKDDFPIDADIGSAFAALRSQSHVGTQYQWLAQFARVMGAPDGSIELCMPRHPEPSDLQNLIFEDPAASVPRLKAGPARCIFRAFSFPTITMLKSDMNAVARREGFTELMAATWFCHKPIDGKPCGACAPCVIARVERPEVMFASPPRRSTWLARLTRKALRAGNLRI